MSGLFTMLSTTARSLDTQRYGLDVVGQNIANINTPGYTRRVVDLAAVPPADQRLNAGGGAEVLALRSIRDRFFDRRLFEELPAQGREGAIVDSLALVEAGLGTSGASIDARLGSFFDSWGQLAEAPTSRHGAQRRRRSGPGTRNAVQRHRAAAHRGHRSERRARALGDRRDQRPRRPDCLAQRADCRLGRERHADPARRADRGAEEALASWSRSTPSRTPTAPSRSRMGSAGPWSSPTTPTRSRSSTPR